MGKPSPHLTAMLDGYENELVHEIAQDPQDPLTFHFNIKAGHPRSEDILEWFKSHNHDLFVTEQHEGIWPEEAIASFHDRPNLAVLFKLSFPNG